MIASRATAHLNFRADIIIMELMRQNHSARLSSVTLIGLIVLSAATPAETHAKETPSAADKLPTAKQIGKASWYGHGFHGKKTASGEKFDSTKLTAAHSHLPLGTRAKITNLRNGREVEVRINDRFPYQKGRIIDLSHAAAKELAIKGTGLVSIDVLP